MVARIASGALVIGFCMLTTGCLTGLGLPPSTGGGGGEAGSQPTGGGLGGGGGWVGPAGDGGPVADAPSVRDASRADAPPPRRDGPGDLGLGGEGPTGFGGAGGGRASGGAGGNPGLGGAGGEPGLGGAGGDPATGGAGGEATDGGPATDVAPPNNRLEQQRWVTQQGLFLDGAKWLAGDFDGDGLADLADVFNDQGAVSIDVRLSNGSTFIPLRWSTGQGAFWDAQKWLAGDFDGDGRTDLANVFNDVDQISIDVYLSTGSGFGFRRWATQQGGFWDAQKWVAGDFDGDGLTDLANVFEEAGQTSIDVHRSTGATFTFQRWATQQGPFSDDQKWLAGRFRINQRTYDLVKVFSNMGNISSDLFRASGSTFVREQRSPQRGAFWDAQKWLAGDFDGDGLSDLANVFNDNDQTSVDVLLLGLVDQRWITRQGAFWDAQQWLAGNFAGDGVCDLANVFGDNGQVSIDVHRLPQTKPAPNPAPNPTPNPTP